MCTRAPKRPTQVGSHAGPSNVLRDHKGIGNWEITKEATKEDVRCMDENVFGNMRPPICSKTPNRPTQTAN